TAATSPRHGGIPARCMLVPGRVALARCCRPGYQGSQGVEGRAVVARKRSRWGKHALRILSAFLVLLVIVAVVWADVVTGFWQEVVVLSGIAAGLLTFVLTGLLLEPSMARAQHRRWEPLTRVALT